MNQRRSTAKLRQFRRFFSISYVKIVSLQSFMDLEFLVDRTSPRNLWSNDYNLCDEQAKGWRADCSPPLDERVSHFLAFSHWAISAPNSTRTRGEKEVQKQSSLTIDFVVNVGPVGNQRPVNDCKDSILTYQIEKLSKSPSFCCRSSLIRELLRNPAWHGKVRKS